MLLEIGLGSGFHAEANPRYSLRSARNGTFLPGRSRPFFAIALGYLGGVLKPSSALAFIKGCHCGPEARRFEAPAF